MGGAPPVGTACENAGAAKNKRRISALSEYLMATSRRDVSSSITPPLLNVTTISAFTLLCIFAVNFARNYKSS